MASLSQSHVRAPALPSTSRLVIDLTNTDDEDEDEEKHRLPAVIRPPPPPSRPAQVQILPAANVSNRNASRSITAKPAAILPRIPTRSIALPNGSNSFDPPAKRRRTDTPPTVTRIVPPKPSYLKHVPPAPILPAKATSVSKLKNLTVINGSAREGIEHPWQGSFKNQTPTQKPSQTTRQNIEGSVHKVDYITLSRHQVLPSIEQPTSFAVKATNESPEPSLLLNSTDSEPPLAARRSRRTRVDTAVDKFVKQELGIGQDSSPAYSEYETDTSAKFRSKYSSSPTTSLDHVTIDDTLSSAKNDPLPSRKLARLKAHKVSETDNLPRAFQATSGHPSKRHAPKPKAQPRPYLNYETRKALRLALDTVEVLTDATRRAAPAKLMHIDFSLEEIRVIYIVTLDTQGKEVSPVSLDSSLPPKLVALLSGQRSRFLFKIRRKVKAALRTISTDIGMVLLRERTDNNIADFIKDVATGMPVGSGQTMNLAVQATRTSNPRLSHLLLQREINGCSPKRICDGRESFRQVMTGMLEDQLAQESEWTDCCGDIASITWTSKSDFICGATAHSDFHNMQYNKPGNLVIGSTKTDTLRAVPNHRIVRPVIDHEANAENALQSMRNTQDPWLYTSVVSTAFCEMLDLAFTASFDQTVKVWSTIDSKMELKGVWYHSAKVNFVVASNHHDLIATACDVSIDAVRVYLVNTDNIMGSSYVDYCGNRTQEQEMQKWAYFPATIQWGCAANVSHLLLVGYSPRSLTEDEMDIPEDKRNTGELCLWNTDDDTRIVISSASMQNVFEVMWHPSQPIFLAATSPSGKFEPLITRTQIRMFSQTTAGTWMQIKALDCPALDINELTILPNSFLHSYVTASCTDGNTYVYDTAHGDQPIHILKHGESLDNPLHDLPREIADTGVKFAAWGRNKNRFYTGASDGRVKAWDITAPPCHAFVRDVLKVSAGVSAGAFSEDFSQLVIGDASGKVHLLKIDDSDLEIADLAETPRDQARQNHSQALHQGGLLPTSMKRPKVVIPHPEPAPPKGALSQHTELKELAKSGQQIATEFVTSGAITIHPDPAIGAIQGPNYLETNLFRYEAHEEFDGTRPLLPEWSAKQRIHDETTKPATTFPTLPREIPGSSAQNHLRNMNLDLELANLSLQTRAELERDRVELNWDESFDFELFPGRRFPLFKEDAAAKKIRKLHEREPLVARMARNRYLLPQVEGEGVMVMDWKSQGSP